jgi:hypothetical protein
MLRACLAGCPQWSAAFRLNVPGFHSVCATSRWPCSQWRLSYPGGSVNSKPVLVKFLFITSGSSHSLQYKTYSQGVLTVFQKVIAWNDWFNATEDIHSKSGVEPTSSQPALLAHHEALSRLPEHPKAHSPFLDRETTRLHRYLQGDRR